MKKYGCQSMVSTLKRVLVKRPDAGFAVEDYKKWHYTGPLDIAESQREHDAFCEIMSKQGIEVLYHPEPQPEHADSVFTYDPAIVTDEGAIIFQMGKKFRKGEEGPMERRLNELGIPTHYSIHGEATVEGGDTLWLDEETLALGQGFRTNVEGLHQMKEALEPIGVKVIPVDLPYFFGPEACLHLMSLISFADHDLAVVYSSLLPVPFWKELKERGVGLIDVSEEEFNKMGTNVLALGPRNCLMLENTPVTKSNLEDAGCKVHTYKGVEISLKTEGGPTCLTRPILRV
ncbi:MAG: arginine deiminase family protein [Candidatus Bathyarchaeota archaeon]|nr:arginine deiminase family protein [Candidatus Bathyarchaeota archaeon]